MITEPTTDTPAMRTPAPATARPAGATPVRGGATPRTGRWWTVVRAVVATVAVLGVVTVACPGLFGAWSARAEDAVPRSIELPWRWQAAVEDDPPGLAAVVATSEGNATTMDVLVSIADQSTTGDADPVLVVGRNGVYRAVYPRESRPGVADAGWHAGENLHLSPDGRYLALPYLDDPATTRRGPTLLDLTTGQSRVVTATGLPMHDRLAVLGWRPDGGALLLAAVAGRTARVFLLDLATGTVTALAEVPTPAAPQWPVAFSPDGARVVLAAAGSLRLVDQRGTVLWSVPLRDGYVLAGGGAFTPDGTRVALAHALACELPCASAPPWTVTYVDSTDGTVAPGPALPTIGAARIRAVGWSQHRDGTAGLVVVRYLPRPLPPMVQRPDGSLVPPPGAETREDGDTGPADLYELVPGSPPRLLLDAPYEVTDLDVAADLVRADRFEGNPSTPSLLPIRSGRVHPLDVVLMVAVLGGLAAVVAVIVRFTGRVPMVRRLWRRGTRPRRRSARSWAGAGTGR